MIELCAPGFCGVGIWGVATHTKLAVSAGLLVIQCKDETENGVLAHAAVVVCVCVRCSAGRQRNGREW